MSYIYIYHLTSNLFHLYLANEYTRNAYVMLGNGINIPITYIGSISLPTRSHVLSLEQLLCAS